MALGISELVSQNGGRIDGQRLRRQLHGVTGLVETLWMRDQRLKTALVLTKGDKPLVPLVHNLGEGYSGAYVIEGVRLPAVFPPEAVLVIRVQGSLKVNYRVITCNEKILQAKKLLSKLLFNTCTAQENRVRPGNIFELFSFVEAVPPDENIDPKLQIAADWLLVMTGQISSLGI
ncbi:MAG: hypothetical protein AAB874_04105 [Patescibacteria group bacterium]